MIKKKFFLSIGGLACIFFLSLFFSNCATIVESKCELIQFEGEYIGTYRVADLIDIEDTVRVEVDTATNSALITSIRLDTFFTAPFILNRNELAIEPINIPYFNVQDIIFTDVFIESGYIKLDGECDQLYIEMSGIDAFHNFTGLPNPLKNVSLSTPYFMARR